MISHTKTSGMYRRELGAPHLADLAGTTFANYIYVTPVEFRERVELDKLGIYLITAAGNLHLGCYTSTQILDDPQPLNLIIGTGQQTPVAAQVNRMIWYEVPPQMLDAGLYWLAFLCSSNTLSVASSTPRDVMYTIRRYTYAYAPLPPTIAGLPLEIKAHDLEFPNVAALIRTGIKKP